MKSPGFNYHAVIFEGWQSLTGILAQQRFRKHLFIDGLGWDLPHEGDVESDAFDTPDATYCSVYHGDAIVGCWRAIRTTEDYLALKVFPQLASLRPYPQRPDVWEISRLGASHRSASAFVYALMFHFAVSRAVHSLCGVITPVHDRNLTISGIKTRRYGAPQSVGTDARGRPIIVFSAEMRPSEQDATALEKILAPVTTLELKDEALVFGRGSVPARPARIPA